MVYKRDGIRHATILVTVCGAMRCPLSPLRPATFFGAKRFEATPRAPVLISSFCGHGI